MKVEQVPIHDLRPDEANPRYMSDHDAAALKRSLKEYGAVEPAVVNADGTIIGGHMRVAAAQQLGWAKFPCIRVDLPADRARLLNLALNRIHGEWDEDKLAELVYELTEGGADTELSGFTEEPETPAAPDDPITKPGDLWVLGEHRLLCGDSTDAGTVALLVERARVALTFTSPPYAVGLDYGGYEDTIENLRPLLEALATTWRDVTAEGGYCVTNFGDVISGAAITGEGEPCEYPMALEYWPVFRAAGWVLHTRRIWAKPHRSVSAPWTASSNRAANDWEHIWTWRLPGGAATERRDPSHFGVWDTSEDPNLDVGKDTHPAGFPTALVERALRVYSDRGDVVADPFGGTGSTLIACENLGRKARLMELSPSYCDVIVKRWEAHTGREAHREEAHAAV